MMQPNFPPPGHIGIVSQSGNLAGSMQHMCWKQDIGISRCVSVGNQAQLATEDFLEYLIEDDQTKVVLAYIESVSNGNRFRAVSTRLTQKKPFVVLKGGRTETGSQAAKSHTRGHRRLGCRLWTPSAGNAVLSGPMTLKTCLIRPLPFSPNRYPQGNRVGIVANGGGWGVIMADACAKAGLNVVSLSENTLKTLDKRLPPWWNRQNPVDLVAGMSRGAFFKSLEILLNTNEIDSLIGMGFGYGKPLFQCHQHRFG